VGACRRTLGRLRPHRQPSRWRRQPDFGRRHGHSRGSSAEPVTRRVVEHRTRYSTFCFKSATAITGSTFVCVNAAALGEISVDRRRAKHKERLRTVQQYSPPVALPVFKGWRELLPGAARAATKERDRATDNARYRKRRIGWISRQQRPQRCTASAAVRRTPARVPGRSIYIPAGGTQQHRSPDHLRAAGPNLRPTCEL